jgi:TorA maturation chaperone TorD
LRVNGADKTDIAPFVEATAADLKLFAILHDREPSGQIIKALHRCRFQEQLSLLQRRSEGKTALGAFDNAIAHLPDPIDNATLDDLAAEYACVYLRFKYRASPTESVWFDDDGLERQDPMFQVRSWYHRHGLTSRDWANRPDDHVVLQLEFLAHLLNSASSSTELADVTRFMDEHILRWIKLFAEQLKSAGAAAYFTTLAAVTAAYLEELRDHLEELTGIPRPVVEDGAKPTEIPAGNAEEQPYSPGVGPGW